jgi:hypothetical protein
VPDWQQPDARGDLPAPPHDNAGHTWRHSDAQLSEIIDGTGTIRVQRVDIQFGQHAPQILDTLRRL